MEIFILANTHESHHLESFFKDNQKAFKEAEVIFFFCEQLPSEGSKMSFLAEKELICDWSSIGLFMPQVKIPSPSCYVEEGEKQGFHFIKHLHTPLPSSVVYLLQGVLQTKKQILINVFSYNEKTFEFVQMINQNKNLKSCALFLKD